MLFKVSYIRTPLRLVYIPGHAKTALGLKALSRVRLINPVTKQAVNAHAMLDYEHLKDDEVSVSCILQKEIGLDAGESVDIILGQLSKSSDIVKKKIAGEKLTRSEIAALISDLNERVLSPPEITAFLTAIETRGLDMDEVESLTIEMIQSGDTITFNQSPVVDHHSIGGVPGNKVTLLVVPLIAAAGLLIPKTCSRAITGAAGTGDLMEALSPVAFSAEEIRDMTQKAGGVIVWGGATNLVPTDDIMIKYENAIGLNPHGLMLASIMGKKKAAGADICVLDIPVGKGTKVRTVDEGNALSAELIELGRRLGMKVQCILTYADAPVGRTIGVNLEVAEALKVLETGNGSGSLMQKSCAIAGATFEMTGKAAPGEGIAMAESLIQSGAAHAKMKEIIAVQGGNPEIKSSDLLPGKFSYKVLSPSSGRVVDMNNRALVKIARLAGAPVDHGAGIYLNNKTGQTVKTGEPLFTIYAENELKLNQAIEFARTSLPVTVNNIVLNYVI
ncbi:MAG TPA: AMP phosphorylase [Methanocorpusculum sp.]|nr:AMP phosphorylase [Methanocorpusculum sp.]